MGCRIRQEEEEKVIWQEKSLAKGGRKGGSRWWLARSSLRCQGEDAGRRKRVKSRLVVGYKKLSLEEGKIGSRKEGSNELGRRDLVRKQEK